MLDVYPVYSYSKYMERELPIIEKSVSIRFPPDLLAEMKRLAKERNRSLNKEVITVLQEHVRSLGGPREREGRTPPF